mmetsp:Transcript_6091/g.15942  ORF Transcript_6091/g.15942 Transcript_6091/m.15942 type:complete len:261 (+) Transcript_6091:373-1155(+)
MAASLASYGSTNFLAALGAQPRKLEVKMGGSSPDLTVITGVSGSYFCASMYALAVSPAFCFSTALHSEPSQTKTAVYVSSRKTSSSSRSACAKSKMGSTLNLPVSLEQWNSCGSRSESRCTLSDGYSPLPPSGVQKASGSEPSMIVSIERWNWSVFATTVAHSTSDTLAPEPCQTYIVSGVSSTKQSPELSDDAFSSTCTARVSVSSLPRMWKRETPSVSYESPSFRLAKPEALPPEWMTILPSKRRTKCDGSLPITTRH